MKATFTTVAAICLLAGVAKAQSTPEYDCPAYDYDYGYGYNHGPGYNSYWPGFDYDLADDETALHLSPGPNTEFHGRDVELERDWLGDEIELEFEDGYARQGDWIYTGDYEIEAEPDYGWYYDSRNDQWNRGMHYDYEVDEGWFGDWYRSPR